MNSYAFLNKFNPEEYDLALIEIPDTFSTSLLNQKKIQKDIWRIKKHEDYQNVIHLRDSGFDMISSTCQDMPFMVSDDRDNSTALRLLPAQFIRVLPACNGTPTFTEEIISPIKKRAKFDPDAQLTSPTKKIKITSHIDTGEQPLSDNHKKKKKDKKASRDDEFLSDTHIKKEKKKKKCKEESHALVASTPYVGSGKASNSKNKSEAAVEPAV